MTTAVLTESSVLTHPVTASKGIWRVCIIEADVEGSSGYYPAEVLMRDGPAAFPAGTHVYVDHPTRSEDEDRPERSVLDIAGHLMDDARYEDGPDGKGLFSRIQFLPSIKDRIEELAPHVGLSIRASGAIEETEQGRIVRSISGGLSVDVVTRAGAGGRLVTMTESANPETPPEKKIEESGTIPSTSGTGALINEVASMKESVSDKIEQQAVEIARLRSELQENKRESEKRSREASEVRESIAFLKDRQSATDKAIEEAKSVGEITAILLESGLATASMVRVAKGYQPGQDIHEAITAERDYAKKLFRESEGRSLSKSDSQTYSLGLTESSTGAPGSRDVSDNDFADIDAVLNGPLY
ncbi:hypothetical protein [Rhodococcus qingshengii]|uniref:hypothetical protein n=1 Tax=Rhodococcus qingshengii TaxID=334542 RepID=UPI0035E242DC